MIKLTKRTNKKNAILKEKQNLQKCTDFCINIKEALHSYISEMKSVKSDNEIFKKMLVSNFKNSIVQIDNNIQGGIKDIECH